MKILVSIVAYRLPEVTARCLAAVRATQNVPFDLFLTNNGADPAIAALFDRYAAESGMNPPVLNTYPTNTGFQIPHERAFLHARDNGYDLLVLLNNDALVPPYWLERIVHEFERHPAAAIVGPQGTCCTVNEGMHGYPGDQLEYIELSASAVSVPLVAKHFPYLFPPYLSFAYSEDLDLSLRMRRLGHTIHQAAFTIVHERAQTSKMVPEAKASQERNHAVMRQKWAHYLKVRTFKHRIVVRRHGGLGDVVLITPVLRALWRANPESQIAVETYSPEILAGNPCCALVGKSIAPKPGDLLIDLTWSSENGGMRHFITSYARTAGLDGDVGKATEMYWASDPYANDDWNAPWCAMHASPTWKAKQWDAERFAEVAAYLRGKGWKILLVGNGIGPAPRPDRDERNRTTISGLAALLSHCRLFVGNDGFPMHVAGAVGIPVVGVFGITDSRFVMAGRAPHIGCDADPVKAPRAGERHRIPNVSYIEEDGSTIKTVTVAQVIAAVDKLI
jgi:GT2 family glycosyltransferase